MASLPHGTVTFMFTDMEGSTRRWAEDPEMGVILGVHDDAIRDAIEANDGHWVKHTGDGVLAVFAQASDALTAAAAAQRKLEATSLRVRIGVHTGEALHRDADYFGLAVSTASRLMDAGHGGQILVSSSTRAVVGDTLGQLELQDLGTHRLKDIAEPQKVYQLLGPGLDEDFPPLSSFDAANHNLPIQLTSFVGRDADLNELVELIANHRLVTLTGVGGAGKTRLAIEAASDLAADEFRDGVRFVGLASVTDPDSVVSAVATAVEIPQDPGQATSLSRRLTDHLRDAEMLLVLDNCEHLLSAAASLVEDVLSDAPHVKVLASSREALGIRGERILQVSSLDLTDNGSVSDAARLFMDRASSVSSDLELDEAAAGRIERICRLLDGIPLAIELAAARSRVLSLEQISERLNDRLRLLRGGSKSALPRQQTLEGTIDWSYQLLAESERQLFDRLAVFVGGFDLDAAERVCTDEEISEDEILDLLSGLVDKSMVLVDKNTGETARYRTLETLRQYGLRKLNDVGQAAYWSRRHCRHFSALTEERGVLTWSARKNLSWYRTEQGNLRAALEWATAESSPSAVVLLIALSELSFFVAGDPESSLDLAEKALSFAPALGLELKIESHTLRALHSLGRIEDFKRSWHEIETRLSRASDDVAAWCLVRGSSFYSWDPELDVAIGVRLARQAVERTAQLETEAQFSAQLALGVALMWSTAEAGEAFSELHNALELANTSGETSLIQHALSTLGLVAMTVDQREGTDYTTDVEDELLRMWDEAGRPVDEEWAVWIAIRRGEWVMAEKELSRQDSELRGRIRRQMLMPRAALHWMQGRFAEAQLDLDAMEGLGEIRRWHHDYYPMRAEVSACLGELETVRKWVDVHQRVAMRSHEEIMWLGTLRGLVMAEVDAGELDEAKSTLSQMQELTDEHVNPRLPVVQMGSESFYLAVSKAELTRPVEPDPEAWKRAEALAFWAYWIRYCRVRRLEAMANLGLDVESEGRELSEELRGLGAAWLSRMLESAIDRE